MGRKRKTYALARDPNTGKRVLAHRLLAEQLLGRPLLPREIVHHRDGDSSNNEPGNLLVLPSQRYHAHLEFHLRRQRLGMPTLFPELFAGWDEQCRGGLFDCVLALRVAEPPLQARRGRNIQQPAQNQPTDQTLPRLFLLPEQSALETSTLKVAPPAVSSASWQLLGDVLAQIRLQVGVSDQTVLLPVIRQSEGTSRQEAENAGRTRATPQPTAPLVLKRL